MLLSNWVNQRKKHECKNGSLWVREMICSIGNAWWLAVACVAQGSTLLKIENWKGGKHLEIPWEIKKALIGWLSEDATTMRRDGKDLGT